MKAPVLLIGLGSPLMGDDAIGCVVAERLAAGPAPPEGVEVLAGGTDLLAWAEQMEGRRCVVIVDAMQGTPGAVEVWKNRFDQLPDRHEHAHHLSAVQAIRLLQSGVGARFRLIGIGVGSARAGAGLSHDLAAALPGITSFVMEELRLALSTPP
ncbi:MAG TPA: hydrogenase maturation protease [Candidatus Sulfopaludibacter sp.]|nr:hydrogenase maturation protease [Candidatus Sulfopaludibacter sp.]